MTVYTYVGRCRHCDLLTAATVDNPSHSYEVARVVAAIIEAGDYVTREILQAFPALCQCPDGQLQRADPA